MGDVRDPATSGHRVLLQRGQIPGGGPGAARGAQIELSPQFAPPFREDNTAAFAALEAIIDVLDKDGWERVEPRGEEWYSYRFRRQVR